MSNNLVSQQLSMSNADMSQMEPTYVKVDSSVNMQMGVMGSIPDVYASHQFAMSDQQMQLVDPLSYISGPQSYTMSNTHLGNMESMVDNVGLHKSKPDQKDVQMDAMFTNPGPQKLFQPNKRKAAVEPMFNSTVPRQLSMPNKRATHMDSLSTSHELPNHSGTNRKGGTLQSVSAVSGSQTPASNRRTVKNDLNSNKPASQRVQTPKGRTAQIGTPRQTESFEAVRSKMRESLASALALVNQNQSSSPKQEKSPLHKDDNNPEVISQNVKLSESTSVPVDAAVAHENIKDDIQTKDISLVNNPSHRLSTFAENLTHEGIENLPDTWKNDVSDSMYNAVLPEEDVAFTDSFFAKDELLQGHGLSWEWEIGMEVEAKQQLQSSRQVNVPGDDDEQKVKHSDNLTLKTEEKVAQAANQAGAGRDESFYTLRTPEKLAFEIEAELFKLFGGVNKKYKEKGRSLMFNLKDRNNPELREKVMSGDITPEKLCSMTAEELASKELSEWRTAKAEELAQMIVLPEDGDRRRLVKKTHKGEYQVEVEQDDEISVEVSVGATTLGQFQRNDKEKLPPSSSDKDELKDSKKVESEKGSMETMDPSYSLTIPADGTDLMQGLIEDEFKDAEFLPPIVSLDEFMESLNSEPPFDNLAADTQTKTPLDKLSAETGENSESSKLASKDVDNRTGKATDLDSKMTKQDAEEKSGDYAKEQKQLNPDMTSMAERVWEGALQLHISALITVIGLYRSGEKTSTKEWPSSLEIKGRVRLDAFEKFLQELPMSRSRAVMVIHFVLKADSSADDRASLREAIDSYVLDERLGFAEPASGMELYLCPPHPKILELLGKHLSKDQTELINSTDNGLIGVVVWRKAHLSSTISPNSTSHHKHSSKKQQNFRRQEKNNNVNANMTPRTPVPSTQAPIRSGTLPSGNDDDDIPPGFGPGNARDDDDLPEFSFSGSSNPTQSSRLSSNPSRPVDQIRELIQKYGKPAESQSTKNWQGKRSAGLAVQAWDDDDDDDIPEWRPDAPLTHVQTRPPARGFHQAVQPPLVNQTATTQHVLSPQVAMPPMTMIQNNPSSWQQGNGRWVAQPPGFQQSSLASQPNIGQFQGGPVAQAGQPPPGNWRRDAPRSRGF
ncbi:hypothetical protein DCAR_0622668 [Daucus carota subsp. sativus]|uniref:TFIIS central domain-containing protein n=1 Tax=Daucus carota subsp. sativus TaxID=79200 RepID=A0A161ZPA5_DAUCS|nr:PREDICTED: uncharacterized protein LOC108227414 [Daucus carota subsp. sativus]XP_017258028.1 PREDICTED: uncharacterized protein LOC108227414 [Daucus carota subsp. sativus]WOH03272.1 hypothetical protein DCAR_0622668 [Daucus carota subsp. sativus]